MRARFPVLALSVLMLPTAFLAATGTSEGDTKTPRTWTVIAGSEAVMEKTANGAMGAWQYAKFYPSSLTVNEGDAVVFRFPTTETYNVVFGAAGQPLAVTETGNGIYDGSASLSSGMITGSPDAPKEFKVTFSKAGNYSYLCTAHSSIIPVIGPVGMVGKVRVQPPGSNLMQSPEQVAASADKDIGGDFIAAIAADPAARRVTWRPGANGTLIWTMNVGGATSSGGEFLRFGQRDLTIKVGDTVEWVQKGYQATHTVSFFSGGEETPLTITEGDQVSANPAAQMPSGGNTYDGTGVVSSGLMYGTRSMATGPRKFSMTFTKAGHFEYSCIPHAEMGMRAHITVME